MVTAGCEAMQERRVQLKTHLLSVGPSHWTLQFRSSHRMALAGSLIIPRLAFVVVYSDPATRLVKLQIPHDAAVRTRQKPPLGIFATRDLILENVFIFEFRLTSSQRYLRAFLI